MNYPNLETNRLILQKISLLHTDELHLVYSDEATTHHVPRTKHNTKDETIRFIEKVVKTCEEEKCFVWSVFFKDVGKVIGNVGLYNYTPQHKCASIGAVIHKDYWRRGIVVEALQKVIEFGFLSINLVRIEASFETNNIASSKIVEKLGMSYEGTLRKNVVIKGIHRDSKMYSLLRDEYRPNA